MSVARHSLETLRAGQRLALREFMRRWEARPDIKFAELLGGVVYMPSPLTSAHGHVESNVVTWLGTYAAHTSGCSAGSQATWLMLRSAPQPDVYLWILPESGGQSGMQGQYHTGAPELAAEICLTSAAYDLGVKKDLYEEAGVREYVAFLVQDMEIRWHRLERGTYHICRPTARGIYGSTVFPGLWLDGPALRKDDMARVLNTLQRGLDSAEHKAFVKALAAKAGRTADRRR